MVGAQQQFKQYVMGANYDKIQNFFRRHDRPRRIGHMTLLAYVLNKYQNEMIDNPLFLDIVYKVIENSTPEELNNLDEDRDTIVTYLYGKKIIKNDRIRYKILKKLVRHGYRFNNPSALDDLSLYLGICSKDKVPLYKPIVEFTMNNMDRETIQKNIKNIIKYAIYLPYEQMRFVVEKLEEKHIKIPTDIDFMTIMYERRKGSFDIQKVKQFLRWGMKFKPYPIYTACEYLIDVDYLSQLYDLVGGVQQKDLDRTLFMVVDQYDVSRATYLIEIIEFLFDKGAHTNYTNKDKLDAITLAPSLENLQLQNLLYSHASTSRLQSALENPKNDQQDKQLIKEHLSARQILSSIKQLRKSQQRHPRPAKKIKPLPVFPASIKKLSPDMLRQLQSMISKST